MLKVAEGRRCQVDQYTNHAEQESFSITALLVTLSLICCQIIALVKNCFWLVQSLLSLANYLGSLYLKFQLGAVRLATARHFVV